MANETLARRLPVYLVLDCSGSMTGEPIEACRQGVKALLADLRNDPQALETAHLAVITFGSSAQQLVPLTDLCEFQEPLLQASGSTALGAALGVLETCLENEVRKSSKEHKGDFKPLVFLMTDGQPTDQWEETAGRIKSKGIGTIVACAAGPSADSAMLMKLTECVVQLSNLQPDQLKAFFRWVSASVRMTSLKIGQPGQKLPPPPSEIILIA
jgi:uncharacterized protein YegL